MSGTSPHATKQADFSVDEYRPIKVICIGAGVAGIVAGIRFRQRISNLDLTIYEKEDGIGGTWHASRYPGISCDIPSHAYQLSFESNTQWSSFYAPGAEIKAYLERVVEKHKLMPYIHLNHNMISAKWDEDTAKWSVTIRRPNGQEFVDTCDVLFLGVGALSRWKWPDMAGLKSFGGTRVHSARWDVSEEVMEDWKDKNVAVVGNGSTGIQIVTALQPRVKTLTHFIRDKTWLPPPCSLEVLLKLVERGPESTDFTFDADLRKRLADDPEFYRHFRHEIEASTHTYTPISFKYSPEQAYVRALVQQEMTRKVAKKPELVPKLIPDFAIGCRRLTPGPGYLEALCEDNATLETAHIARVTETGLELTDGRHIPLDVLVCATGYDTTWRYPFPITGRNGKLLTERWADHAEAYLAIAVDGFPNLWLAFGPNSALNSGSEVAAIEKQVEYAVAGVAKMQRERLRTMEVKVQALRDFNTYAQEYFKKTVYHEKCSTWYRNSASGVVTGPWPGSCLHLVRTLSHPRWEDFEYTQLVEDEAKARFYWLGDGLTYAEKTLQGDRAWYLNEVDHPPIPSD
ncbi:unnamed protein product [Peniophora sp. CBMAI 1063]|nr:unnamed protein product [Peniophora sp. CBMAI 1063]